MEIKLKKLKLQNFKGIRDYELLFDDRTTSIGGENGAGKTTIADAIFWLLFNKNYAGSTTFGIKTLDENGNVIPNIVHAVSLTLSIDGNIRDIRKEYKEVWKSYRGEESKLTGHTSDFYIDGDVTTKGDYEAFIASFIGEGKFRAITNPNYFLSLNWKEQRSTLIDIVGEVGEEEINPDHKYDEICPNGQYKTIEDLLKHIGYNIKIAKERSDLIPELIKEQNLTKPEEEDFDTIRKNKDRLEKELAEYKGSLLKMQNGEGESVERKSLRSRLDFAIKRKDNILIGARKKYEEDISNKNNAISSLRTEIQALENKIAENKISIGGAITLRKAVENRMTEYENKKLELDKNYKEVQLRKFSLDKSWEVCPTCGRKFNEEKIEEITKQAKSTFNETRAKRIEELKASANELLALIEEAKKTSGDYEKKIELLTENNNEMSLKLLGLNKTLNELSDSKAPTCEELLAGNESYKDVEKEIETLETQLEEDTKLNQADRNSLIDEIKEKVNSLEGDVRLLNEKLLKESIINSHNKRIDELTTEQKEINAQLADLYRRMDLAREYQQKQGEILEEKVNDLFTIVKFKLFKERLNENVEPFCEAWINNVPYADVNAASKLNGGLDIINTLCKLYGVSAPIIIDNAESTTSILPTLSQQIRLYVTNSKELIKL